jgi:tRNA dimethylallyltransferase
MMYFRALTQGLADLPASVPSLRTALQQEVDEQGIAALHAKLAKVDAQSAKRLNPMDTQRVMRAYEVYLSSGKSMTAWLSEQQAIELPWVLQKIALIPQDRSWLHQRIALRLAQMREAGFLNEVKQLYARGDLGADMTAMRSVGYRQMWQFLAGEWDEETAWEKALVATRQLAKRQLTWLRSEPDVQVLDPQVLATKKEIFSPFV